MPRVHRIASLLKRWILGTHQGAVSHEHLDYYLDEFTFRFNRRRSSNRGKLFYRLVQQAVAIDPAPYKSMVKCVIPRDLTTTCRGYLSEVNTQIAKYCDLAIYLTQVTQIYSVRPRGGLSAGSRRIRAAIRDRGGVPGVPGATPVARRLPLSTMRPPEGVAGSHRVEQCAACAHQTSVTAGTSPGHAPRCPRGSARCGGSRIRRPE